MIEPIAGDLCLHIMPDSISLTQEVDFTHADKDAVQAGDIPMGGFLTTESRNLYKQVVHTSTFDHADGLTYWSGRVLHDHGRRFLTGGGSSTPVGRMTEHSFLHGRGMRAHGHFYKENDALFKRAVQDKTLNAWSIGFRVLDKGASMDRKADTLHIRKGELHEVSACNVGVNRDSHIELLHSLREQAPDMNLLRGYCYIILGDSRYLVTQEGEILDA